MAALVHRKHRHINVLSQLSRTSMKYFSQLQRYSYCIRRKMSTYKLSLWENSMFVNSIVEPGKTERKLAVCMSLENSKKKVVMLRSPDDSIKVFIERLKIKLQQIYAKKKSENSNFSKNISFKVDGITVPIDSTCGQVFKGEKNITLQIKEDTFKVVVNAPLVKDLKLGVPPYKGLMLYPYAFDMGYNVSILDSKYLWYRIDSKNSIEVGNEIIYIPTENDVNCRLKLVCNPCNEQGQFGPKAEIESSTVLENTIETYPFQKRLKEKPINSIRVVSYNILAEEYAKTKEAKNDMYPYCSAEILASSYRSPLILKELMAYNPDILCLQEVESNVFTRELSPLLKQYMNMCGVYLRKSSRRHEGLSCFYSCDKFNLLNTFHIKLNDLPTITMYCGTSVEEIFSDDLWKQALEKQTVFQIIVLELNSDTNQLFLVCNTHLVSDAQGDPIRLLQALIQLVIINQIKQNVMNDYPERKVSVIFCGDFNSTPESGVYDLITSLLLPEKHNDVKVLNDLKRTLVFNMESAYDIMDVSYSNYTQTFNGLLDYIFFTKQHLELIQVLPMPSHEDVTQHVGLPSVLFPSDHLALIADLKVK